MIIATRSGQTGATLFIALVFLAVISLFVIAGINLSTTSTRTVTNMESHQRHEAAATRAIEDALSTPATFEAPAAKPAATVDGVTVNVPAATCLSFAPAEGDSVRESTALGGVETVSGKEDTVWEVQASTDQDNSGAVLTIRQGVLVQLVSGGCL